MRGVRQKFSGSDGAATSDAGRDDRDFPCVTVSKTGDDCIVAIVVRGLLLGAVDQPILTLWILAVGNPEAGHVWIIRKMKTQRIGEAKRPGIIEGSNKNRGAVAQISKVGRRLSSQAIT